jgi:hypothetical protein
MKKNPPMDPGRILVVVAPLLERIEIRDVRLQVIARIDAAGFLAAAEPLRDSRVPSKPSQKTLRSATAPVLRRSCLSSSATSAALSARAARMKSVVYPAADRDTQARSSTAPRD